ncbi:hypothetical protein PAMA_017767 [Pampus argenteus]
MGQEFHVLRCFTCESFQVQQVKKVNRWNCKLCGEKQSLLKEFGRGSGADCRRHVQKLNAMRRAMIEEQEQNTWLLWKQMDEKPKNLRGAQVSRWSKYLDTAKNEQPETGLEKNVLMDRQHLHGNKRKRTHSSSTPEQADCFSPAGPSPGCRLTGSLSADCRVGVGSTVSGWSDTTDKPPLQLPVSMFESGDDFSFDEF